MSEPDLYLDLFGCDGPLRDTGTLENRLINFINSDPHSECLDDPKFDKINGSELKADFLMADRQIIAEMKTLNGDPTDRLEKKLQDRMAKPDAPIAYGTLGVGHVLKHLDDGAEVRRILTDLAGRAVRRNLKDADEQIAAIKSRFDLPTAGGLVVLMNDNEPLIDASTIGFVVRDAFTKAPHLYRNITNLWVIVESHRIVKSDNRLCYPELHIFRGPWHQPRLDYMARMLDAWGRHNGGRTERIEHHGKWDAMRPVYDGPVPTLNAFG